VDVCLDDKVRERHLDYYLKLTENAEPELRSPRQVAWLDRLEKEVDNIRAALEWAVVDNIKAGLRMASALYWFWHIRNHKKEGINWLERVISADPSAQGGGQVSSSHALIRGKALNVAGSLLMMQGMLEPADIYSRESLKIYEDLGPEGRQGVAHALWNLSQLASQRANTEKARELSEKSLALYRELNDKFGVAQCLDDLGGAYLSRGDYQQAREIWEEDLKLRKEMGDKDGIGWSLSCLGDVAFYQGDIEKAMALFTESLNVFREVGNHWAASRAISGTGIILLAQGDFERAIELFEEALAFGREMGDPNEVAGRRYDLARVARSMGDYKKAEKFYEQTLDYVRNELHNKDAIAGTLVDLGEVAWARGDLELATRRYEESLAIGREIQAPLLVASASSGLGRVAFVRGEHQKAHALLAEAVTILKTVGDPWNKAYVLHGFAILAVADHNMERAVRLFGATETTYLRLRFLISPMEREKHEADLAFARSSLGEERFTRLLEEGRAMTLDQAVEYALAV
jgi:tetratricopeptide (TPR) repeat protein